MFTSTFLFLLRFSAAMSAAPSEAGCLNDGCTYHDLTREGDLDTAQSLHMLQVSSAEKRSQATMVDSGVILGRKKVDPTSIPAEIRKLAEELLGPKVAASLLENSEVAEMKIGSERMKLHVAEGDDSIGRFGNEDTSYGIEKFSFEKGAVVLDVGANVGSFTISAWLYFPHLRVFAFEPVPTNYLFFRWNLLENGVPELSEDEDQSQNEDPKRGVMAIHAGLSADGHNLTVQYSPKNSTLATTELTSDRHEFSAIVPSVQLPQFLTQRGIDHVQFFKMDCQGCEHEIIPVMDWVLTSTTHFGGEIHPCDKAALCSVDPKKVAATKEIVCKTFGCCSKKAKIQCEN